MSERGKLTIQYDEVDAKDIINYWLKGYQEGLQKSVVEDLDWFYDARKSVFVLKLFVRKIPEVAQRDTSTPEGRETWEAVDKAAAKAPDWLRDRRENPHD